MKKAEKLAIEVGSLGSIPASAKKILNGAGVKTVGDVMNLRESGLRRIPNVGEKTIKNLRGELENMKLYLLM